MSSPVIEIFKETKKVLCLLSITNWSCGSYSSVRYNARRYATLGCLPFVSEGLSCSSMCSWSKYEGEEIQEIGKQASEESMISVPRWDAFVFSTDGAHLDEWEDAGTKIYHSVESSRAFWNSIFRSNEARRRGDSCGLCWKRIQRYNRFKFITVINLNKQNINSNYYHRSRIK